MPESAPGSLPLEDLFRERYQPMVRLAYLLTGSTEVAEDLVQDSFAQLQRHAARVKHPPAYLRQTVVNACRAHHRRHRLERDHFADLVTEEVAPETHILLDAVAALPYRQRAALVLRFYEDQPEDEIAGALGCRPATVRSLIHRGLARLREVIEQ